jgi:hypothetical protein
VNVRTIRLDMDDTGSGSCPISEVRFSDAAPLGSAIRDIGLQSYWVSGLCTASGIRNTIKHEEWCLLGCYAVWLL